MLKIQKIKALKKMHNLIVGITNSGKTQLVKTMVHNMKNDVVIYDPMKSSGWSDNALKFSDPKKFFYFVENNQNAFIICDEAKNFWHDGFQKEAERLLTQTRHNGQLVFLIAQRAKMIPPTARAQCSQVYAFRQNVDDSIELAREYHAVMRELPSLKEHHFIYSDGFNVSHHALNFEEIPPKIENILN